MPSDGWKCISYKPSQKGIALLDKNEDNRKKGVKLYSSVQTTGLSKNTNGKKKSKPLLTFLTYSSVNLFTISLTKKGLK